MIDNHKEAILLLEIFDQCIQNPSLPSKASPCHRKIVEVINASGLATCKRRVGKPSKHAKAIEGMASALKVIHTWATFEGGKDMDPRHVADLTKRAISAFEQSRIDITP